MTSPAAIHLLGIPRIVPAGGPAPVLRGHKVWGVLAFLLAQRRPVRRQHLAQLLFEDADDPLAALRWNLSELRRALGGEALRGDTLSLDAGVLAVADVVVLGQAPSTRCLEVEGLGRPLLESLAFAGCPSFEVWLQSERRRVHALSQAVLHEAALARLSAGAPAEAADLAGRLLALDPFDEEAHVLLVRCLAAAGDGIGAARQAAACRDLLRRELGVSPGPALSDALATATAMPLARPATGRAGARAQLEAGEAAVGAGALDAGLQCLRRAIVESDAVGDPELRVRARLALGGALVHAARGRDAEGAAALHEVLAIGRDGPPALVAAACRELGYVDFLVGRYERALAWVARADALAGSDLAERGRIATLHGSVLTDLADYAAALPRLAEAQRLAAEAGEPRQLIYAASMRGRALILTGEPDPAAAMLERCIEQARRLWTAFLPWPQALRAEVDLRTGAVDRAADGFQHAFALGCQLGDPCWEGIAGRGLGLVEATRGHGDAAIAVLLDALQRCGRLPDAYAWARAYTLDALCETALDCRDGRAAAWVGELARIAARAGMRELVARSHRHRARLGEPGAAEAARVLAEQTGNALLMRQLSP